MRAVCVIPARGGSKGLPGKNLARVGGRPLVVRSIQAALSVVDEVLVSTDDPEIAAVSRAAGARVVVRPDELSGDTATSESAVLHALAQLDGHPDVTVFVQCTSPFIDPADLAEAVRRVADGEADVVFSALESHEFQWSDPQGGGQVSGVGHSAAYRPRRQDRAPHFRETGAFYVMRTSGLLEHGHRFFGRIAVQTVPAAHATEVDTAEELELVRAVARLVDRPEALDVDALVTDFDGVHTDDRAHLAQDGGESVTVSREDGMGISLLKKAGVPVLILSTEVNPVVRARAEKLGVPVLHGIADKASVLEKWLHDAGWDPARVAYVGNDVNDLGCLALVGWPIAVPDAHPEVLAAARLVLSRPGGGGAVREVCELILNSKDQAICLP